MRRQTGAHRILERSDWVDFVFAFHDNQEIGPRKFMIPDFLIAAHARTQADYLAAIDRGYPRSDFPDLAILRPQSGR